MKDKSIQKSYSWFFCYCFWMAVLFSDSVCARMHMHMHVCIYAHECEACGWFWSKVWDPLSCVKEGPRVLEVHPINKKTTTLHLCITPYLTVGFMHNVVRFWKPNKGNNSAVADDLLVISYTDLCNCSYFWVSPLKITVQPGDAKCGHIVQVFGL